MEQRWTDEELKQLEDPDEWDWDHAVRVKPAGKPGAAVLLRFTNEEFYEVDAGAERLGKKLTEFIKEAALSKARSKRTKRA